MDSLSLSCEQKKIIDFISKGQNILILGPAGSGKSTFLKHFLKTSKQKTIVLAPTGISALNVSGQTIHSFFQFPPSTILTEHLLTSKTYRKYRQVKQIIIDEISMVRIDVFNAIDLFLKKYGPSPFLPFGGVQMILIGDLLQLPPIVSRQEQKIFQQAWSSPYFFNSTAFVEGNFEITKLTHIYRQKDPLYQNILNEIRVGKPSKNTLRQLNSRVLKPTDPFQPTDPLVTLSSLRSTALTINYKHLNQLSASSMTYTGRTEGHFRLSSHRLPSPIELRLKEGAQVIFTKNDPKGKWVNGLIGTVFKLFTESVQIKVDHRIIDVFPETWENYEYFYSEHLNRWDTRIVGSYTQYPLELCWAMTIHKSQGQTLDYCLVDLKGGVFAPGQFYVALSRCRSFNKLFIQHPISLADIQIDPALLPFA